MSAHNILYELSRATEGGGRPIVVIGASDAVPSGVAGYAVGGILIKPGDSSSPYKNTGTAESCTFTSISTA